MRHTHMIHNDMPTHRAPDEPNESEEPPFDFVVTCTLWAFSNANWTRLAVKPATYSYVC